VLPGQRGLAPAGFSFPLECRVCGEWPPYEPEAGHWERPTSTRSQAGVRPEEPHVCGMQDPETTPAQRAEPSPRKPPWLKVRAPGGERYERVRRTLHQIGLHTVCQEARCPNMGECWGSGNATVMLLGDTCTRGCRFCAIKSGRTGEAVDPDEPRKVAEAIAALELRYVVLTMVTRDDLPDGGAMHVACTVRELRARDPGLVVEVLVSDFRGQTDAIDAVLAARPDVFAHNLEVTRAMTPRIRDRRFSYDGSLRALGYAKAQGQARYVKSSIMVGVGEQDQEVHEALADLRAHGVDIVTLGQYLRPSARHAPVARYVEPELFRDYQRFAERLGFSFVAAGPLVRSSYRAAEVFVSAQLGRAS
jgi:lipoyl synthase